MTDINGTIVLTEEDLQIAFRNKEEFKNAGSHLDLYTSFSSSVVTPEVINKSQNIMYVDPKGRIKFFKIRRAQDFRGLNKNFI